jgi:hypothetical protein
MADQFDQAQAIDLLMAESALAQHAKKAAAEPKLLATGECLNPMCCEPLTLAGQLFCNSGCAKEHARRK